MLSLLRAVLLALFSPGVLTVPHNSAPLRPRNDSAIVPTSPGINVTITNNNSLDVTASFQTKLWVQPKIVAVPGLTGRGWGMPRLINKCTSKTAVFRFSHCNHVQDIAGSMQRYVVYCRELMPSMDSDRGRPTSNGNGAWHEHEHEHEHTPPVLGEEGTCDEDEICINGLSRRTGFSAMARCINKDDFRTLLGDGGEDSVQLGNRMASLVLSRADGSRPLGAGSLEAAYAESGPVKPKKHPKQKDQTCEACFELSTPRFAPNTDSLKIEASLMTAAAVSGVMWLAVLSG